MALPTGTEHSYTLPLGIREDLQDVIYNIDPAETPFMSNIGTGSAATTYHEWQTDTLTPAAANAVIEGDDPTNKNVSDTVRIGNYTQISQKTVQVSETMIAVEQAGITDRLAYEMAKCMKELKRDLEFNMIGVNAAQNAGSASVARVSASVSAFLESNTVHESGSSGADPATSGGTAARTDDGTPDALEEADLETLLDSIWDNGGDPTMVLCGSANKRIITGFLGNAAKYKDADTRKVVNAVDVYVSDYGEVQIVPDRYIRTRDVLVIDPEFWEIAWLRPVMSRPLAKTGDSEQRQIIGEWTLVSRNEKSSGGIFDLT